MYIYIYIYIYIYLFIRYNTPLLSKSATIRNYRGYCAEIYINLDTIIIGTRRVIIDCLNIDFSFMGKI